MCDRLVFLGICVLFKEYLNLFLIDKFLDSGLEGRDSFRLFVLGMVFLE